MATAGVTDHLRDRPGAWVDLALTLPIVLVYQLAVVFLGVHNATDVVTGQLLALSAGDRSTYLLATLAIGVIFAGTFALLGRGQAFRPRKFLQILIEGTIYAFVMALAANVIVGRLFAWLPASAALPVGGGAPPGSEPPAGSWLAASTESLFARLGDALAAADAPTQGRFVGFIMSLGAGFYEELAFRVVLFGLGAKALVWIFGHQRIDLAGTGAARGFSLRSLMIMTAWAIVSAMLFSGVHYWGPLSDDFQLKSFTFRTILGLALTLIFVTRGFSTAVWTHAIYDVWVLVLR